MKYYFVLFTLALAQGRVINEKCDLVKVHNIDHEKEVLKANVQSPYQLAIDYDTSTLFFSHNSFEDSRETFWSAYLNLKTNQYGRIPGVAGGFANAVDKTHLKVYLGGRDGIYTYDYETKKATKTDITDKNIWQMFYKDGLYFSIYPDEKVFYYKDNRPIVLPELEHTRALVVAVDKKDDLIFSNSSGLFSYKKQTQKTIFLGDYNLNGINADMNGDIYFSTPEGIYFITDDKVVKKLVSLSNIYGVVVEGDNNIIYATENSIIRLKPSKRKCRTEEDNSEESNI